MTPRRDDSPGKVWMRRKREKLVADLEVGEELLAEGRASPYSFLSGTYFMVTRNRILWIGGTGVVSLPFDPMTGVEEEIVESHRYLMRIRHGPVDGLPEPGRIQRWDLPARLRRRRERELTILRFSRRDTQVAKAIRSQVRSRLGDDAFAEPPLVRPHRREKHLSSLALVRHPRLHSLLRGFSRPR